MILNIFRKDLAQLWLLSVIVALMHLANAAIWFFLEPFGEPRGLLTISQVFSFLALFGSQALIVLLVHQEVLPGVSQDWLVRPIRRRDLLLSKLLFLVVVVQCPMLLADLAHAIGAGFPFSAAFAAALSRNAFVLLSLSLPLFAIATVTRTLVQVAAALISIWLFVVLGIGLGILARGGVAPIFAANGIQWMTPAWWSLLACSTALLVIPVQYLRRSTHRARGMVVAAVLLAPLLSLSPWAAAFSVQQHLSSHPALSRSIMIAFNPDIGRSAAEFNSRFRTVIFLPIQVSGLPPDSFLMNDRAEIRIIDRDGATIYRGRTIEALGYHDDFPVRTTHGGAVDAYQRIELPDKIPAHVLTNPVRVEMVESMTLFRLEAEESIPALDADASSSAFGRCRTKLDSEGDDIELGCEKPGPAPACTSITLENPADGVRGRENFTCDPDYAPYRAHIVPDGMSQFGGEISLGDLQGSTKNPGDPTQFDPARLIVRSFQPAAHFTRRLVIPAIRLDAWTASADLNRAHVP